MIKMFQSFAKARRVFFQDKKILILSLLPPILGGVLYFFVGRWFYYLLLDQSKIYLQNYLKSGFLSSVLYFLGTVFLTVFVFLIVSWTFVLVVSLLASPLNYFISRRTEKKVLSVPLPEVKIGFWKALTNDLIKSFFMIILSISSFALSYFPVLLPVTFILLGVLMAVQFLDYSWSRHDFTVGQCFRDFIQNFFSYTLAGLAFVFFLSIPLVNLLVLPYAVVYFTTLWSLKRNWS